MSKTDNFDESSIKIGFTVPRSLKSYIMGQHFKKIVFTSSYLTDVSYLKTPDYIFKNYKILILRTFIDTFLALE
jgi:hypothetical protein